MEKFIEDTCPPNDEQLRGALLDRPLCLYWSFEEIMLRRKVCGGRGGILSAKSQLFGFPQLSFVCLSRLCIGFHVLIVMVVGDSARKANSQR